MARPNRTLLPLASLLLGGCYTYAATPVAESRVGREVRVALTDSGSLQLAALVGPRASALQGRLAARENDAVTLAVNEVVRFDGTEELWKGERVAVPATSFQSLQSRTLSRGRTLGLGVGLLAAAFAAIQAFQGSEDVTLGGGTGGGSGSGR